MWGDLLGAGNYLNRTYSYTYDDNGNILSVRDDDGDVTTYTYDAQNQLTRENNQAGNFTHTWTYDTAGNILSRSEYAYTTGELGTATNTVTYGYEDTQWGDLLTSYDGDAITYDAIGNPTYSLVHGWYDLNYTWKHGRQLASWEFGDSYMQFTYDANGMRTKATCNDDVYEYVYNGSQLVQMKAHSWVADAVMAFTYDAGGTPQTITYNGTKYYYITNLQGDVETILDGTGAAVVQYTYDAWGKPLSTTGPMNNTLGRLNPLRYRGYVYDFSSGLYYLQSRYYDPKVGRFINGDAFATTGQGLLGNNMFAYCSNNPVLLVDTTGMLHEISAGGGGGGLFVKREYPGLVRDQNDEDIADLAFGLSTVGDSGCASVAAYNTLLTLDVEDVSFKDVLAEFNSKYIWELPLFGIGGTYTSTSVTFFEDEGYRVVTTAPDDYLKINFLSYTADACMLRYDVEGEVVGHIFTYYRSGKTYKMVNEGSSGKVLGGFRHPATYVKENSYINVVGIFIYK